jgi:hypothetical protein
MALSFRAAKSAQKHIDPAQGECTPRRSSLVFASEYQKKLKEVR